MGTEITVVTCVFVALRIAEMAVGWIIKLTKGDKEKIANDVQHDKVLHKFDEMNKQCNICQRQYNELQIKIDELLEFAHIMINMHEVKDNDGTPMWYFPRSLSNDINSIKNESTEARYSQEQTIKLLDKIASILEIVKNNLAELQRKHE